MDEDEDNNLKAISNGSNHLDPDCELQAQKATLPKDIIAVFEEWISKGDSDLPWSVALVEKFRLTSCSLRVILVSLQDSQTGGVPPLCPVQRDLRECGVTAVFHLVAGPGVQAWLCPA